MDYYSIYKNAPIFLQNFVCYLEGLKIEKKRYNKEFYQLYDSLIQSDNWTADQIVSYKEENIARILEYVYKYCPYYKERFGQEGLTPKDFRELPDLLKFPTLTKEEVRKHWQGMVAVDFPQKEILSYHTSGSSGKALDFLWSRHNLQFYWAEVWRGRHRFGIHKGDKHLNFTGKLVVPISQMRPPYWRVNKVQNQWLVNMQHMTRSKAQDFVDFINANHFVFLTGYPSIIYAFALLVEELGLTITSRPRYVFTAAEKTYDHQREVIERVFNGAKIIEHYAFSENAACASKHPQYSGYFEDFELGHLELDNPTTTHQGTTGRLLATGFQNLAMPFVRYEIGDTATFASTPTDSPLHSQYIVDIEGRNEDYVLTPEGTRIMRFDYIFKESAHIKECQVSQRELGEVILTIVKRDNYSQKDEDALRQAIEEFISPTLRVRFEYTDQIPRTAAGKFKAVVSYLNQK